MRNLNVHTLNVIGLNKISLGPGLLSAPKQATPWKDYASQSTLIFQLDCVKNGIKKKNEYTTPDGSKYRTIDGYIYAIKE